MLQRWPRAQARGETMDTAPPDGERPAPSRGAPWCAGSRVAAGRSACQRAARVLRDAPVLWMTRRPPRGSDGSYGPCGPAWTGRPGRPPRSRDAGRPPDSGMAHRTGTGGVGSPGRSRLRRPRRPRLRVVRRDPQGLQHSGRGPWLPVDVPGLGGRGDGPAARGHRGGARPRRRQQGRGGVRTAGPVRAAAAPHGRLGSLPCRRAPEGAGAHRADRTTPCRAGVGHASHRVGPCARNAGPGGLGRIGSGRQPAGAWVSSTSHATTAPGRPRAVGVRSSSTVIATLSTATASSSPGARPFPAHAVPG